MNKTVEVKGMEVKARAEGGLLINEVATVGDDYWRDEATAASNPGTALLPTSTTDGTAWFHANSKIASDEAGATQDTKSDNLSGDYTELELTADSTSATHGSQAAYSIYYKNNDGTAGYQEDTTDNAYYVKYTYYLKVSSDAALSLGTNNGEQNVAIKSVDVTLPGTPGSADLDKALRVGIMIGDKMYIYAPVYGSGSTSARYFAVTSIDDTGATQAIENQAVDAFATNAKTYTALDELPGMTEAGEQVDVYVWFEGEDDNCQSDKITDSLDDITIDITFSLETLTADAPTITNNEF